MRKIFILSMILVISTISFGQSNSNIIYLIPDTFKLHTDISDTTFPEYAEVIELTQDGYSFRPDTIYEPTGYWKGKHYIEYYIDTTGLEPKKIIVGEYNVGLEFIGK